MATAAETQQERLKKFLERRHPMYEESVSQWTFLRSTYEGGRDWFNKSNIFRYLKEGTKEFKDRLCRAYRFNHTRECVDLVDKYLFKMDIARTADAPTSVKKFWAKATLLGLKIKDFMRLVSKMSSIYGRIYIVIDNDRQDTPTTVAEQAKQGVRTYAYILTPEHVLDMSFDQFGELNWILVREVDRDDVNPLDSGGSEYFRFRLWERNQWTAFTIKQLDNNKTEVVTEGPFDHDLGKVPVIIHNNTLSTDTYTSPAMIADIAYLDRAVANYLSNLDAIIQDQTFSQLVMPAQGMLPGDDKFKQLVEMGTKRIFTYDGEHGGKPEYISPDPKQAEIILQVIAKIINEIYHSVGLAGERTKEDNSQGIDNSSGVAKAYDFERVNSLLAEKADSLEVTETKMAQMVADWDGETLDENDSVQYPDNFDVRGLYDEFDIAARLALIEAPDETRRNQMELLIEKLFPKIKKAIKEKMIAELKSWPPKPEIGLDGKPVKPANNSLANQLVK